MTALRRSPRLRLTSGQLRLLQLGYDVRLLTTPLASWLLGKPDADGMPHPAAKSTTSESLSRLVDAGLLTEADDPIRRTGGTRHFYAVTAAAYRYLRPVTPKRQAAVTLDQATLIAPTLDHTLDVATLAVACTVGLPMLLLPDVEVMWYGEATARRNLTGRYLEPDGCLVLDHEDISTRTLWVEHDRATEGTRKWTQKLSLYAQAVRERALPANTTLLITTPSADTLPGLAARLAPLVAAQPLLSGLVIWLAPLDALDTPLEVLNPVWRQLRSGPGATPLYPPVWSLVTIVEGRQTVPSQVAAVEAARRERERQAAAAQTQAERETAWRTQQVREQEERDRARQVAEEHARLAALERGRQARLQMAEAAARQEAERQYRRSWKGRGQTAIEVTGRILGAVVDALVALPNAVWWSVLGMIGIAVALFGMKVLWDGYAAWVFDLDPRLGTDLAALSPLFIQQVLRILHSPAIGALGTPLILGGLALNGLGWIYQQRKDQY